MGHQVVGYDRRKGAFIDEAGVWEKFGVAPESIPDYLALVGDSADGLPGVRGWGAKTTAAVLAVYPHLEDIPLEASLWKPAVRGPERLVEALRGSLAEALVYRFLATLRRDVPLARAPGGSGVARGAAGAVPRFLRAVGLRRPARAAAALGVTEPSRDVLRAAFRRRSGPTHRPGGASGRPAQPSQCLPVGLPSRTSLASAGTAGRPPGRYDEETQMTDQGDKGRVEEFRVKGEELLAKVKELIREGNIRRIIIDNDEGKTLIEIPMTIGVVGALLLPALAAVGAVAALVTNCTIRVERREGTL